MSSRNKESSNNCLSPAAFRLPDSKRQRGFTLLELVMVMTIIVILAAVGVTAYQSIQLNAKETVLKQNLNTMRKLIDEFAADKERLPSSLQELADLGYMREVPIDPISGKAEWDEVSGEDTVSLNGGRGIVDVKSLTPGYEDF